MPRPAAGSRLRSLGHGMLLLAVACGAEPDTAPSPPAPPAPPAQRAEASPTSAGGAPPSVRVRFEPQAPISGSPLRAEVEFDDPGDEPSGLRYRWTLDGRRLADVARSACRCTSISRSTNGPAGPAELLERLASLCPQCEFRAHLHVRGGEAGPQIVRLAQEQAADLIVVAWKGDWSGVHSATLKTVIQDAPCPVMVVRAEVE